MYWCPLCKSSLQQETGLVCPDCGKCYRAVHGFYVFDESPLVTGLNYGLDHSLLNIENEELIAKISRYFTPQIGEIRGKRILSVGCGGGADITKLNGLGAEAYGMDFLYRTSQWNSLGFNPQHLFVSSAAHLPFPKEYFDIILCMGVIEHVAEQLLDTKEYQKLKQERYAFLKALLDVLKQGGILLISTPNRNFPIDFQHDHGVFKFLRQFSVYPHSPLTRRLESYHSVRHLLKTDELFLNVAPLPLTGFIGFNVTKVSPQLRIFTGLFKIYSRILDQMPGIIRTSFLNPYVVLKVIKQ